jgi:primosomal protein N' (replication factor Y)
VWEGERVSGGDVQPSIPGFEVPETATSTKAAAEAEPAALVSDAPDERRVVRVLPDAVGIDKEFDYRVPDGVEVQVGDVVRVPLQGRRVGAWVVAVDVDPPPGIDLKALTKVSGRGPAPELIDLAGWAAERWAGRRASFLRTAAPPGVVRSTDRRPGPRQPGAEVALGPAATRALAVERAVLRLGPGADRYPFVFEAARRSAAAGGQVLVLCPGVLEAQALGRRLRRDGVATAIVASDKPDAAATGEWTHAASGRCAVVVGSRAAAWAPAPHLDRVVVLDEHDEGYQQEQAPTWHAREVVIERARRAGVPCTLLSPCPSLEALAWGDLCVEDRAVERATWPRIDIVDQRELDPALGPLFSPRLVDLLRSDRSVVCVLNRTGRARLLACMTCSTLARCGVCDAAVHLVSADDGVDDEADALGCGRCGTVRPMVCLECGGHRFKNLRLGVSRAREELEALAGRPVAEITAATPADDLESQVARVVVGTEAALHRIRWADAVAFLDFDQELLALRYRAAEEAMALLVRAGRLVQRTAARSDAPGSRSRGLVLVQTRTPEHPVLGAAHAADPGRLVASELPMRRALGVPPATAMAAVSGDAAPEFMAAFGEPSGIRVQGPLDGVWRIIAPDHARLSDALLGVARPPGRLRIAVDPLRL